MIIDLSSVTSTQVADPGETAYGPTEAGIWGFTKALAIEFAGAHINVNMICPGVFLTPVMEMQERADTMTNGTITAGIVGASGFAGGVLAGPPLAHPHLHRTPTCDRASSARRHSLAGPSADVASSPHRAPVLRQRGRANDSISSRLGPLSFSTRPLPLTEQRGA